MTVDMLNINTSSFLFYFHQVLDYISTVWWMYLVQLEYKKIYLNRPILFPVFLLSAKAWHHTEQSFTNAIQYFEWMMDEIFVVRR